MRPAQGHKLKDKRQNGQMKIKNSMKQVVKLSAFILLVIGTLGLLINEFIFDWGSTATLTFAALNVVGLAILAYTYGGMKKEA